MLSRLPTTAAMVATGSALLVLGVVTCGGDPGPDATASSATAEAGDAGDPEAPDEDPLLAQARTGMVGGKLPEDLRAKILGSSDPAHARAKRILGTMERQARGEAEPGVDPVVDAADPVTPSLTAPPPGVTPPPPIVTPPPATVEDAGESNEASRPPPAAPRLAVLTRLSLQQKGTTATLTVHAGSSLQVGVAKQASGKVRLVVESAGALPVALQARPAVEGVVVSDVRRGQDTVQIAIDLGEGWSAGRPVPFAGGARLKFTRD